MAEPARTSPPVAGVAERDVLLATKLHVPRPRSGFLPRPRLLERLAEGMGGALILVCTPAGFGKTTLLADWARGGQPVGWVSLDEGDNDPTRFWRYVTAALDPVRPGIAAQVAALLQGPRPPLEAVVTAVVNQLAARPDQVALVVDDYHLIEAPPVHAAVVALLERPPPQLRLVVAGRADPPLPLARLRARGQLVELREGDLRFTSDETAVLLREAIGLELPAASLDRLAARTEGWVAGLQLAGLSLRGHADPVGFVDGFSGSHRYVLDYLTQEVLDRQPEQLVRFLLETSILARLSGSLCDAVVGRPGSQQLLEEVERANLFLVPLDEVRGWWRYHQLFADLLQARLQQAAPERLAELHRAAAAWHEQHGLADEAIRHALAAGNPGWAAQLIEQHAQARFQRTEGATVNRWLKALPAGLISSRPQLGVASALWAIISGRVEEVEPLLQAAEDALAATAGEPPEASPGRTPGGLANPPAMIALLRAELARQRGDADRTIQFAQQGLALADADDGYIQYMVRWNLAVGTLLQGRVEEAEAALAELAANPLAAGADRYFAVLACYTLGRAQRAQGRLGAALGSCQRALALAAEPGHPPLVAAGMAHIGLAEVLYERGELDSALQHATEGVALCRQLGYGHWQATGLTTLAWIRRAKGDQAGALAAIGEAEGVAPSRPMTMGRIAPVAGQRARLLLAQGETAEAARWATQRGLDVEDEPSYAREREYLLLVGVLLVGNQADRALGLLERLHLLAVTQARGGSVIEVRVLQALALAACREEAGALATLAEALTLAAPEGYLRVFVDEGAPMAALLGRLNSAPTTGRAAAARLPAAYLDRLLGAFGRAGLPVLVRSRRGGVAVPGLVEPLTARELQVLELLAAGQPNQTIAEELVITLDTVKRHVTHILDKLGVANRTQAVTRARELGLLR